MLYDMCFANGKAEHTGTAGKNNEEDTYEETGTFVGSYDDV